MKKSTLIRMSVWLSVVAFLNAHVSAKTLDKVTVEQGVLQGGFEPNSEKEVAVFKGVPFAKPPVGPLRWKAPQPADNWQGIKLATEFAPSPMQGGEPYSGKSEDCLYLNVWTPAKSTKDNIPVFIWIYGGGFSFGSASDPLFNGAKLAEKGVIVVTIAYRVGQLGFLAHPQLSAENPQQISGNYGLFDQIAALEWIQKNIRAFGGDPKNVTIAGESAGGISVSMLAASPLADGLFHKAISQSGGSFGPTRKQTYPGENMISLKQAEAEGVEYAKQFETTTNWDPSIDELRKLPAEKFIPKGWSLPGGWPIVDGHVIPDDQFKLYEKGAFNHVPALMGYNSDEGLSFVWNPDAKQFITDVDTRFGQHASKLKTAYGMTEGKITRSARNLIRDAAFGWHSWSWARLQTRHSDAPTYLYYFDQHPDYPTESPKFGQGSPHAQDVAYVFQQLDENSPEVSAVDIEMSEKIATYWTNFAKTGNPNSENLPHWPKFKAGSNSVMYFQQQPKVGDVPDETGLRELDKYFHWRRSAEGKAWADQ